MEGPMAIVLSIYALVSSFVAINKAPEGAQTLAPK